MKFAVTNKDLIGALKNIVGMLPSPKNFPLESGVLLNAFDHKLELQGRNGYLGLKTVIPANVLAEGSIVVNGKNLLEAVSKLGEIVHFEIDDNRLNFCSSEVRYSFNTTSPDIFEQVQQIDADQTVYIAGVKIKDIVDKVAISRATDTVRPMFNGILFDIDGDKMTAAATNAHRLSVLKLNIDKSELQRQLIIPALTLNILIKDITEDVKISFNDKQIAFDYGNNYLISGLIDGIYPPYNKVAEEPLKNNEVEAVIPVDKFKSAVERMSFIANAGVEHTIRFSFDKDKLNISAEHPEIGSATEDVELVDFTGHALDISFNVNYITDFLKAFDGDKIKFIGSQPLVPSLFTSPIGDNFSYIVSPLRVRR